MSKPHIHAESSVRQWGGEMEDYLPIHELMDSTKELMTDVRHRVLTHNSWFIKAVLPKLFGENGLITNSEGKKVSVALIGEQHVLEDYGNKFIPSPVDFISEMEFQPWMDNGRDGYPPSVRKLHTPGMREKMLRGRKPALIDIMGD